MAKGRSSLVSVVLGAACFAAAIGTDPHCPDTDASGGSCTADAEAAALWQAPHRLRSDIALAESGTQVGSASGAPQWRCRSLVQKAPSEMQDPLSSICSGEVVYLRNDDFKKGTFMITKPGIYVLAEDIVFEPDTPKLAPPRDSEIYPASKGFFLGFFAAITVAADNVMIDLAGHSIVCSYEFILRQRFFQVIELANLPFVPGAGPPPFSQLFDPIVPASSVVITSGDLGLSSHISIHGNDNRNIWVHRVRMFDFEVAGFQLNNGSNVHLTEVSIGPTLGANGSSVDTPALGTLSQAINVLRQVEDAPWEDWTVFRTLDAAVETFILQRLNGIQPYPAAPFADPEFGYEGLPDGSALYGIVVTPAGPATGDFDDCEQGAENEILRLSSVKISGLASKTDEVVQLQDGDRRAVVGPAGDVFQVFRVRDNTTGKYVGNVLSDAQAALGKLANENRELATTNFTLYFRLFGGTYFPEPVLDWVAGKRSLEQAVQDINGTYVCGQDSQAHINKGIVALRVECVDGVGLRGVKISDLLQKGGRSPFLEQCASPPSDYAGADARGARISGLPAWYQGKHVKIFDVRSVNGRAIGFEADIGEADFKSVQVGDLAVSDVPGTYLSYVCGTNTSGVLPGNNLPIDS